MPDVPSKIEIVTEEIVEAVLDVFFELEGWRSTRPLEEECLRNDMRAALRKVAPLFAERYATKIDALADAYDRDIASGIGKIDPELERKRKEQGYGLRDAAAEIRFTKGNPHG